MIVLFFGGALLSLAGLTALAVRAVMRFRPAPIRPGPIGDQLVAGLLAPLPFTLALLVGEFALPWACVSRPCGGGSYSYLWVFGAPFSWAQLIALGTGLAISTLLLIVAVTGHPFARSAVRGDWSSPRSRLVLALLAPLAFAVPLTIAAILPHHIPCAYVRGCPPDPWYSTRVLLFGIRRFSPIGWALIAAGLATLLWAEIRAIAGRRRAIA